MNEKFFKKEGERIRQREDPNSAFMSTKLIENGAVICGQVTVVPGLWFTRPRAQGQATKPKFTE